MDLLSVRGADALVTSAAVWSWLRTLLAAESEGLLCGMWGAASCEAAAAEGTLKLNGFLCCVQRHRTRSSRMVDLRRDIDTVGCFRCGYRL